MAGWEHMEQSVGRVAGGLGRLAGRTFAWLSFLWAVIWTALFAGAVGSESIGATVTLALAVLAALSWVIGFVVLGRVRSAAAGERERDQTQAVLRVARRNAGVVTEPMLVEEYRWTREEAVAALRHCSRIGLAEVDANERGDIIYRVPSLVGPRPPSDQPVIAARRDRDRLGQPPVH